MVRSTTLRLIFVTAAAAGLGWAASTQLGLHSTAMAAVAAALTVQASVPSSVKEASSRILATLSGMAIAVLAASIFGTSAWTAAFVVAISLILGRLVGLGPEGATAVPATSLFIFVLGSDLQPTLVFDRMGSTALGVLVGVLASIFSRSSTPMERAKVEIESLASEIASLLSRLAAALPGCTLETAAQLQKESAALDQHLEAASREVDAAVAASRLSRAPSVPLLALLTSLDALATSCNQVRALSGTLATVASSSSDLPEELSAVLDAASGAFSAHAEAVGSASPVAAEVVQSRLDEVGRLREESVKTVRNMDDTGVWLLAGAVLTEVDRMVDELELASESAPAEPADLKMAWLAARKEK